MFTKVFADLFLALTGSKVMIAMVCNSFPLQNKNIFYVLNVYPIFVKLSESSTG